MGRSRTLSCLLGAIFLLTPLAACAGAPAADGTRAAVDSGAFPVTIDDCGIPSTVEAPPERAVTMNQGATEVALALGLQDRMVGTAYIDDQVADKYKDAYDTVDVLSKEYPDQETLLGADPDFVYGSYTSAFDGESVVPRQEWADLGVGTYTSPLGCKDSTTDVSFENVWAEIDTIATVFDVEDRAKELRARQRSALDDLRDQAPGKDLEIFWYDSGDKTPFAGTGDGGPQLIIDALGASNLFDDVAKGWADVPWEDVVQGDPDVIVLADASWSTAAQKKAYLKEDPVLSNLRAVRENRFVTLPFSETTPGVRLVDGAESLGNQLQALN